MTYDAGTSVGKYVLQADAALKVQQQLIAGYQALAKASGIKPPPVQGGASVGAQAAALQKAALAQQKLATEQQKTVVVTARANVITQQHATEQQRTAAAVTNAARAEQLLARDTANAAAAQDRAAQAAIRRQRAESRPAGGTGPALPRTFAGFTTAGAGQLAGLAGGAFSIQAVIGAGQEALALRETQNGLRAVAGSVENYQRTLKAAREQQELFGGTLRENIEGLTGLTITSRQSGATLETLIDLSQRLAVLDPAQGAAGARIALSEALSGDPTSLAKRYEIPRAALAKLRDETTSASDKLLVIDQYLNKVGVSSEAVAGRIDQDALAFRRAKAEIEEATLRLGDYITRIGAIPARGITELLDTGAITGGARSAGDEVQGKLIAQAGSFEAYAKSVRDANEQIKASFAGDPVGGALAVRLHGLERLNPVQVAYAQNLIKSGVTEVDALTKARALGAVSDSLTQQTQGQSAAIQALVPIMAAAAGSSEENAGRVLALNSAYLQGQISADVLRLALEGIIRATEEARQKTFQEEREMRNLTRSFTDATPPAVVFKDALAAQAIEAEKARQKSQELTNAQSALANIGGAVRDGLITSGQGATILAGALQLPIDKARELLQLQAQIAGTAADVQATIDRDIARAGATAIGKKDVDLFGLPTEKDVQKSQKIIADAKAAGQVQQQAAQAAYQKAKELADSEFQLRLARAKTNADKIAIYQDQLNKTTDKAERNRIEATIASLKNSGGGSKPTKGLSVLDQDAIQAGETLQAQLDAVNKLLERQNLTAHQRNDLLEKQRRLEEQIGDEIDKQNRARVDAQLGIVQDAQKRLKETPEAAGLERALASGRISETQRTAAGLRLSEIALEQQKRALDIQKDQKVAGVAVTQQQAAQQQQATAQRAITPQVPIPNVAQLPPAQPSQVVVNLTLNIDKNGTPTVKAADPNIVLNLLGGAVTFRNLSGGA